MNEIAPQITRDDIDPAMARRLGVAVGAQISFRNSDSVVLLIPQSGNNDAWLAIRYWQAQERGPWFGSAFDEWVNRWLKRNLFDPPPREYRNVRVLILKEE